MRCNCENADCLVCHNRGCKNVAGLYRAMYIGAICDGCVAYMPAEYLINPYRSRVRPVYLELAVIWRGNDMILETSEAYDLDGPMDDEGMHYPACLPFYMFTAYAYSELTASFEIDVTEQLSEYDNIEFQRLLHEYDCDMAAAAAEARLDRD